MKRSSFPAVAALAAAREVRHGAEAGDPAVGRSSRASSSSDVTAPARFPRRAPGDRSPATLRRGHVVDLASLAALPGVLGDLQTGRALPEQYVGAVVFCGALVLAIAWCVWCWKTGRGSWLL